MRVRRASLAAASEEAASLDLIAANGSLLDCQFIDMLTAKIGVAILERGQDSRMGRFFAMMRER